MTPYHFRAWRKQLDLTQQQAGDMLGVTRRTVVKWETGDTPIANAIHLAVAHLYQQPRIWKLTPLNLDHPSWRISLYRGEVIVRAVDDPSARHLAGLAYGFSSRLDGGRYVNLIRPWHDAALCEEVATGEYEAIGLEGVLSPARYYCKYFESMAASSPVRTTFMALDAAIEEANRLTDSGAVGIELLDENNLRRAALLSA